MKIGINASFLRKPHVGIGQVTLHGLNALFAIPDAQKHEFMLYLMEELPADITFPSFVKANVILPPYTRDDMIRKMWWEISTFPRQAVEDNCDVVLSMYQSPSVFRNFFGWKYHVMLVHDIIPKFFPDYLPTPTRKLDWALTERAMRKARRVITVSHHTKMDLKERLHLPQEKIVVAHISCDPQFYTLPTEEQSRTVLQKYSLEKGYVYTGGGLEKRKNVESTVRAYATLLRQRSDTPGGTIPPLVISGKLLPRLAPLITDVEQLVLSLGIQDHVRILGFVPQEDLPSLYANALFFLYPSLYEGFGLPVLEAMCMGTPVITTKRSSLPEVGGDAPWYTTDGTVEEIFTGMRALLGDKQLRSNLAQLGRERSRQFRWDPFADTLWTALKHKDTL